MGFWGNLADRLSSVLCNDLLGSVLGSSHLAAAVPSTLPLQIKHPQQLLSTFTASKKEKKYNENNISNKEDKTLKKGILKKPLGFF